MVASNAETDEVAGQPDPVAVRLDSVVVGVGEARTTMQLCETYKSTSKQEGDQLEAATHQANRARERQLCGLRSSACQ